METIHKYPLEVKCFFEIQMPYGARVLSVQCQDNIPTLWAIVETDYELVSYTIACRGTGHNFREGIKDAWGYKHVGTVQDSAGYVWHYFLIEK